MGDLPWQSRSRISAFLKIEDEKICRCAGLTKLVCPLPELGKHSVFPVGNELGLEKIMSTRGSKDGYEQCLDDSEGAEISILLLQ